MQPTFGFIPAVSTPQGDGSYIVRPGRPVDWMPTTAATRCLRLGSSTLRRWIDEGKLPAALPDGTPVFRKLTPKKWEFNVPALIQIKDRWTREALAGNHALGIPKR